MIEKMTTKPTWDAMPEFVLNMYNKLENIERMFSELHEKQNAPKYVNMKGAEEVTGKSANALRVQISLGNLKSIKKGSRHYFERSYLEEWLTGSINKGGVKC
jgi:hypothetical protein